MNKHWQALTPAFIIAALLSLPSTSRAQVGAITSGGFAAVLEEILPEFRKTTGITVTTARRSSRGNGPNTIGAQLRRGVPADGAVGRVSDFLRKVKSSGDYDSWLSNRERPAPGSLKPL